MIFMEQKRHILAHFDTFIRHNWKQKIYLHLARPVAMEESGNAPQALYLCYQTPRCLNLNVITNHNFSGTKLSIICIQVLIFKFKTTIVLSYAEKWCC